MIWIELTGAAVVGGVIGWSVRAFLRPKPSEIVPNTPGAGTGAAQPSLAAPGSSVAGSSPMSPSPVRPKLSEGADTARRVILHLWSLGRLEADRVAPFGFTQRGMTRILGIRQGNLTKVLSRLEAAGVVLVDRRHVEGEPRRLKVYRLTHLGESVARDLARRRN